MEKFIKIMTYEWFRNKDKIDISEQYEIYINPNKISHFKQVIIADTPIDLYRICCYGNVVCSVKKKELKKLKVGMR